MTAAGGGEAHNLALALLEEMDDRVLIGSYDGTLYCLMAKNGAVLWKVTTDNYVHATPAVADGVAHFSGCDEVFHGIRISDGKQLFEFPSGAYTAASPALAGAAAWFGTFSNEVVSEQQMNRVWLF